MKWCSFDDDFRKQIELCNLHVVIKTKTSPCFTTSLIVTKSTTRKTVTVSASAHERSRQDDDDTFLDVFVPQLQALFHKFHWHVLIAWQKARDQQRGGCPGLSKQTLWSEKTTLRRSCVDLHYVNWQVLYTIDWVVNLALAGGLFRPLFLLIFQVQVVSFWLSGVFILGLGFISLRCLCLNNIYISMNIQLAMKCSIGRL